MNGGNNRFLKPQNRFSYILIRWILFCGSWLLIQTITYRKLKSCFLAATMALTPRVALVTSLLGAQTQTPQTKLKLMGFIAGFIHNSTNKPKPEPLSTIRNAIKSTGSPHKTTLEIECTNAEKVIILCKESRVKEAMDILRVMDEQGIAVDFDTYSFLLQGCTSMKALAEGKRVHAHLLTMGFEKNNILAAKLIGMYSVSGSGNLMNARQVFDKMHKPSVCVWNAMIKMYANNELCEEALGLYYQMEPAGVQPDKFTFPCVLKACAHLSSLEKGKEIHNYITANGLDSNLSVDNALVAMYTKCGCIDEARHVFLNMREKDVVSWNTMITGYTQNGKCGEALKIFEQMELAGVKPNSVTIASILPACARVADLDKGKQIHDYIIGSGIKSDIKVDNALIDMYAKCGSLEIARRLFDKMSRRDVVSWSAIIAGYAQNGHSEEALEVFRQMQVTSVKPNSVTIVSVLPACANVVALQQGKEVHGHILRFGLDYRITVWNALIDMYAKCRKVEFAGLVFDKMHDRDAVSWNAIIAGYAQNGYSDKALILFRQMEVSGSKPDAVTLVSVLPACAHLAALQQGKEIHNHTIRHGFEAEISVGNTLIDMYAKCGRVQVARKVFDKMTQRNVVSWNVMIAGYGMHGHGENAVDIFYKMQKAGTEPDYVTFIAILFACSHAGLVDEGLQFFDYMGRDYHITPRLEHYACLVDILGRAGKLDDAQELIKNMPFNPDAGVWGALLGACRIHHNTVLGEIVAERLFELEPENPGYYILLSNIYAASGRWGGVEKVRTMMKERGVQKTPGCSWIGEKNKIHAFFVGDKSHPQSEEIYALLENLEEQMKEAGYIADTNFVLHDVQEGEKIGLLCGHSERLAIAFGLLNTDPGTTIRITKNLRVCGDCHHASKFISKLVGREIIVRDARRFHRFMDGMCSCRDYW